MRLFLLPCSCNPCHMWFYLLLFLPISSFSFSCLQAVLAVMLLDGYSLPQCGYLQLFILIALSYILAAIQLFLLPCSYISNPRVAKLPCECSGFIPRAWPFYCSRFTAPSVSSSLSQSHANYIPARIIHTSLALLRTADFCTHDRQSWISI